MSAELIPLRRAPSLAELESQLSEVDRELDDALAALAADEATDDEVADLRRKRAKIEDRIVGAKLRAERAEAKAVEEDRAAKLAELETILAARDALAEYTTAQIPKVVEVSRMLAAIHREVARRIVEQDGALHRARAIARELGRGDLDLRPVSVEFFAIACSRAVGAAAREADDAQGAIDGGRLVAPTFVE